MIRTLTSLWREFPNEEPYWDAWSEDQGPDKPRGVFMLTDLLRTNSWFALRNDRNEIVEKMPYPNYVEGIAGRDNGVVVDLDPDGTCVFTHHYIDVCEYEVVIPAQDVVKALEWRIAIIESTGFRDPNAKHPTCDVNVEVRPYSRDRGD